MSDVSVYAHPAPFSYHRAASVDEAVALLAEHADDAAALAGGMSLIPRLKARVTRLGHVVDISHLADLRGEARENGALRIGALTAHVELARSDLVRSAVPVLAEAAAQIGDPQVRNAGTIGGSLAEVYPGADLAACLLALGAVLHCAGPGAGRTVSVAEQFAGEAGVATGPAEIVVAIEIPVADPRSGGAHVRLERRAGLAVVGATAQVTLDEAGRYAAVRAAVNGLRAGPSPVLDGGGGLTGCEPDPAAHREAAHEAVGGLGELSDIRGSAAYRERTAAVVLARALDRAAERAQDQEGGGR